MTLFPGGKGITRELLKVGVGPVSLDHAASLLGNPAWKGELNLAVVHLGDQGTSALASRHNLAPNDLDGVGPGPVSCAHVAVALGDGRAHSQVPVLAVHVVGSRPGIITKPDSEVLDLQRLLLADLLHGDDLAGGLLELPELPEEVPETGLG